VGFIKKIKKNHIIHKRKVELTDLPFFSLIIAAYNEESVIERKIKNSLDLDYPSELYEIIVFSDGSTDQTDTIVQRYVDKGVKLLRFERRIGKTACQNHSVKNAKGSIIVYSDATSLLSKNCLQNIARKFTDKDVGCVVGRLESSAGSRTNGHMTEESLYLSFLQWLKKLENSATMPVGGSGALFAVQKELTVDLPDDANDDLLRPLYVVLQGFKVVYDQESLATETHKINDRAVFRKKIRIAQRAVTSLILYKQLLNPVKYGLFSLQFCTKVLLRRLVFPALVIYLISGTFLYLESSSSLVLLMIAPVVAAICLALYGRLLSRRKKAMQGIVQKLSRFCYYYFVSTTGAFIGILKGFCGCRITKWN
jgi:cellulose synthase/poly-beta-1,6-N-acetylglucosamine synthase-like glycosyltransferase